MNRDWNAPTLHTARLRLEPLTLAHEAGMFELWSDPVVCRYSGEACDEHGRAIPLPARAPADSNGIITFFERKLARREGLRWAMIRRSDAVFLGAIGFNSIATVAEIAWHQCTRHCGAGFATEAAQAAMRWVTDDVGVRSIEAFVEPPNLPCIRLLERLGFVRQGGVRDGAQRYVNQPGT